MVGEYGLSLAFETTGVKGLVAAIGEQTIV